MWWCNKQKFIFALISCISSPLGGEIERGQNDQHSTIKYVNNYL